MTTREARRRPRPPRAPRPARAPRRPPLRPRSDPDSVHHAGPEAHGRAGADVGRCRRATTPGAKLAKSSIDAVVVERRERVDDAAASDAAAAAPSQPRASRSLPGAQHRVCGDDGSRMDRSSRRSKPGPAPRCRRVSSLRCQLSPTATTTTPRVELAAEVGQCRLVAEHLRVEPAVCPAAREESTKPASAYRPSLRTTLENRPRVPARADHDDPFLARHHVSLVRAAGSEASTSSRPTLRRRHDDARAGLGPDNASRGR